MNEPKNAEPARGVGFSIGGAIALAVVVVVWLVGSAMAEIIANQNAALETASGADPRAPFAQLAGLLKWCAFFLAICATSAAKYLIAE